MVLKKKNVLKWKRKKCQQIPFINSISVRFSVPLSDLNSAQSEKEMKNKEESDWQNKR